MSKRYGYVRVSTVEQNLDRQLDGVSVDVLIEEKASAKDVNRPQLQLLLNVLGKGDVLVCHSMDRLARGVDDLRKIVKDLTAKGVRVEFVKEGLTFTGDDSPTSNLLLTMLGAVAEFERSLIRERQREGIAVAKAKGVYSKPRAKRVKKADPAEVARRVAAGESKASVAKAMGVSRQTVYAMLAM